MENEGFFASFCRSKLTKMLILIEVFVIGVLIGITYGYPTEKEMVEYFYEIKYICFNNNRDCYQMVKVD